MWAGIESEYSGILATISKADPVTTNAVYQAIVSGEARQKALDAAATAALRSEEFCLIRAVVQSCKASRDQRNDFAHHIWGVVLGRNDCVALADPKVMAKYTAEIRAWSTKFPTEGPRPDYDFSKVLVYWQADFDAALERAAECQQRVGRLQHIILPNPGADQMREALLADQQVARLYEKNLRESAPAPLA